MRPQPALPSAWLSLPAALLLAACSGTEATPTTAPPAIPTSVATSTATTTSSPETTIPATTIAATTTTAAPVTVTTTSVPLDELELDLMDVADGFEQPVHVTGPPGDPRLFVVDQPGLLWVIDGGDPEVFLDIRDRVLFGGEQGLLGLAFPPDHADTGLFYLNYVTSGPTTRVSELRVGEGVESERVLLQIPQPASNHNGGMIAFGPDGYLWIGMGDGGGGNDRFGNAQDPATLLGAMLRIDPDGDPYGIPDTNPGGTDERWAPEIWAIGLRNPWRFSFDGDDLWIADVGQNAWEEIDLLDAGTSSGANLGWPLFEGSNCHLSDCDPGELVFPVAEYSHDEGCSVTGGVVYRGEGIPELSGHYFYGDYCAGWVRSLSGPSDDPTVTEWFPPGTVGGLTGFGVDAVGELYLTSTDGTVLRLERAAPRGG